MKEKERQIEFEKRVQCGIAYCEDIPNNQIEEIQNILPHIEVIKAMYGDIDLAKYLYDRDIRKIPEDSVVISRKKYDKLISLYDEVWSAYYDGENNAKVYYENIKIPQVRKEGAREFYDKFNKNICYFEPKNKSTEYKEGYIQAVADICGKLDKTAIELGVDLREYYGKL